jgi:sialate O-acetylesterase
MLVFQVKSKASLLVIGLFFLFFGQTLFAQLTVAPLFNDHAVLQRDKPVAVWGWSKAGTKISVSIAGKSVQTTTARNGKWMATLPAMPAGGPFILSINSGAEKLSFTDVWLGEVWLCSGQSNMEWKLSQAHNYATEKPLANQPMIRQFFIPHEVSMTPKEKLDGGNWVAATSETAGDFTAVGYFFAKDLVKELNVAVGLIHSSWGGSQLEGWLSKEAMLSSPELQWYAKILPDNWAAADSLQDLKTRKQLLGSTYLPTAADENVYTQPGYDFSKWHNGGSPLGQWDWKGIWAFRGIGFMARYIDMPAAMVNGETILGLGIQDNENEVYVNGKLVSKGILKGPRKIKIPAGTWKEGKNSLVVKFKQMADRSWYGLGVEGSPADLFVEGNGVRLSIADDWKLMPSFASPHEYTHSSNNVGTSIYNAMIAPLVPFSMQGVLWYQGETNAGRAIEYRKTMPLLINDWRRLWKDTIGFYITQLSSYGADKSANEGSNWAELREAQTMSTSLPHTGIAVTTDAGNPNDIHPTDKLTVGKRLALAVLHTTYKKNIPYSGPVFDKVTFEQGRAILSFHHTNGCLVAKGKYPYLQGFEVAGADKVFYYAKAEIDGDKVIVYHPKGATPASVRYAWSDAPIDANLYNGAGLPAGTFRTDDWPAITREGQYESILKEIILK